MPRLEMLPEGFKPDPAEFDKFDNKTFIIKNKAMQEVIEVDLNNNTGSSRQGKLRMWFIGLEEELYDLNSVEFIAEVILD